MKTNETLQKEVQEAIKWEPLLNAAEIGVTAKDGMITLTGTVDSYAKKLEAEAATKKVAGVKIVVEKIKIEYPDKTKKNDGEIAKEVLDALAWNWQIPEDKIKIKVENGWVTLDGDLEWDYQREEAQKSLAYLMGIKGMTNNLNIKSYSKDAIEKNTIEAALLRNWSLVDEDIEVSVKGNKVTLNGVVNSLYQKEEAAKIVWRTPGVCAIANELAIDYND